MAADFVRRVATAAGQRRIAVGNMSKLLSDSRALAIERMAQSLALNSDSIFRAPFHYYLTPFALSSKLWQARIDTPAALTSMHGPARGGTALFSLAQALNRNYRPVRAGKQVLAGAYDPVHAGMIEATGAPDTDKLRRQGELVFSVGTERLLSPAASTVPALLRELTKAARHGQSVLPLTWRLFAAFLVCLIHPFVDGNGRLMRAIAATHDETACRTGILCRAIAVFLQGRQKLWNITLPLALHGNASALWDHFAHAVHASSRLARSVDDAAQRYQDLWGMGRSDLRSAAEALLVANCVLSDYQFSRLMRGSSVRIRRSAEQLFKPAHFDNETPRWINSGAQQLVSDTASLLIVQL